MKKLCKTELIHPKAGHVQTQTLKCQQITRGCITVPSLLAVPSHIEFVLDFLSQFPSAIKKF